MANSITMLIGGVLLILGIGSVLGAWLGLRNMQTPGIVEPAVSLFVGLFFLGLIFCFVGVFMVFFRHVREKQV